MENILSTDREAYNSLVHSRSVLWDTGKRPRTLYQRAGTASASEKAAKVDARRWSLRVPGLKPADALLVTARQGKTEVRINTAQQLWSHIQPLPVPQK